MGFIQGFWHSKKNLLHTIKIVKFLSKAPCQELAGSGEIRDKMRGGGEGHVRGACSFRLVHLFVLIYQCSIFISLFLLGRCTTVLPLRDPRPKVKPGKYTHLLRLKSEFPYFIQASFVHIIIIRESFCGCYCFPGEY